MTAMELSDEQARLAARQAMAAAISQHAAYSYRAASAHVNALNAEIDGLSRRLVGELAEQLDGLSAAELQAFAQGKYTTSRLKALRAAIEGWVAALAGAVTATWVASVPAFAAAEAAYASALAEQAAEGLKTVTKLPDVYASSMRQPAMGQMVDDMLKGVSESTRARIYATLRGGVASGQTNSDLIRALRGTQSMQYKDGLLEITKRDAETVVRTARNHVSNVAYEDTWQALGVTEVMDLATLDGRTSKFCASIDGRRHKVGEPHPKPPYHPRCRTVQVPVLGDEPIGNRPYMRALKVTGRDGNSKFRPVGDMTKKQREAAGLEVGQVKASTKFAAWFRDQDAAFQKEWLGPKRYQLYKQGGYTLDRFVDPRGGEYTLEQLRARDAETFRNLFGA
jgi:SPP1 gp7 family putative phage head morphogenesis protein